MMSIMDSIKTGKVFTPPRIIMYAIRGFGKSTFGASMPKPIFIPTEDGLREIDTAKFPMSKTFDEVMEKIYTLHQEAHDYKTVVLDSLDWLERLIWQKVSTDNGVDSIEKIGYGKGYKLALVCWQQFVDGLDHLRDDTGMAIVCLAHHHIKRFDSPEIEPYDRYLMKLHPLASDYMQEWADAVLFGNYEVLEKKSDVGFSNKVTRATGSGRRLLYTEERPAFDAKNRYGMPFSLVMDKASPAKGILESISDHFVTNETETTPQQEAA